MLRVGEAAWLLELGSCAQVVAAHHALLTAPHRSLRDIVPGASTLLVVYDADADVDATALARLEGVARNAARPTLDGAERVHHIPVRYDGEDLVEIAQRAGLSHDEVIARHATAKYRVAFVGFQPGFAYLAGLPLELHAARRSSPRARVPKGSVAIGGEWTGVYPLASPGGWNLIGTTDVSLFEPEANPPALLQPGDVVRFVPS